LVAVCGVAAESVARNVSATLLATVVGVPLIRPVAVFRVSPAGSVPTVSAHVYGGVPPVAASVWEYATPTCPSLRDAVVIDSVVGAIVKVRFLVAFCVGLAESVARNVNAVFVTAVVGVPLIRPVLAFNVRPAGSVPAVSAHV
jgi:hypothetical protein